MKHCRNGEDWSVVVMVPLDCWVESEEMDGTIGTDYASQRGGVGGC